MKKISILLSMILIVISLCSCNSSTNSQSETIDFFAMDTVISLKATGKNATTTLQECKTYIEDFEQKISRTITTSEIYKLNHSNGEVVTVSDDCYDILEIAYNNATITDGAFDPTICPITDLWGIGTENAKIPTELEIKIALQSVSYKNIKLLGNNKVQLLNNAMIDLGGVGKGFCADKLKDIYTKNSIENGMISLSGNIYAFGKKNNIDSWKIGVTDPDEKEKCNISLEIENLSVVTTGAYERFFEKDGKIYHHIFNSKTGYPTNQNIKSVTVISENSTLCDIYSTALFAMGYEDAIEFLKNHSELSAIIIRDDNKLFISDKISGFVTFGDKYEVEK